MGNEIGADRLLGYIMHYTTWYLLLAILAWASGVAAHYIKKCKRDDICFKEYWTTHMDASVTSIVFGLTALVTTLVNDPKASLITYFGIGYAIDSMVNKADSRKR